MRSGVEISSSGWRVDRPFTKYFPREPSQNVRLALDAHMPLADRQRPTDQDKAHLTAWNIMNDVLSKAYSLEGKTFTGTPLFLSREQLAENVYGLTMEVLEMGNTKIGPKRPDLLAAYQKKVRAIATDVIGRPWEVRQVNYREAVSPIHWQPIALLATDLHNLAIANQSSDYQQGRVAFYQRVLPYALEKGAFFSWPKDCSFDLEFQALITPVVANMPRQHNRAHYIEGISAAFSYLFPKYQAAVR